LIYLGPNGLVGCKQPTGQKDWRDDSGRPMTERQDASIRGDFGLPDLASIEFEISWTSNADFRFALGVDEDAEDAAPRMIRAVIQDGSRVSGDVVKIGDGVLDLSVPGIQEPLRLPLAGLRALVVLRHDAPGGKGR
jgi:hypothetical protein